MGKVVGRIGPKVGIGEVVWYPNNINQERAAVDGLSERAELCFYRLRRHYIWRAGNLHHDRATICTKMGYKTIRSFNPGFDELIEKGIVLIEDGMIRFPFADDIIPVVQTERAPWPLETVKAVFDMAGGHCTYCGTVLVMGVRSPAQFHIDHKTPISRGGTNALENLTPSCRTCNISKGALTLEEFLAKRGAV